MHITSGVRQLAAAVVLVLCSALGADPSFAINTGTFTSISPTNNILIVTKAEKTRLTFIKFGTNKVLGTYDPGARAEGYVFSLSERFVCISVDGTPYNKIVVVDLNRHARPVLSFTGASNRFLSCREGSDARFRGARSPLDTRANNLVVIEDTRASGPGNCLQRHYVEVWELRNKRPKIFKQFVAVDSTCP